MLKSEVVKLRWNSMPVITLELNAWKFLIDPLKEAVDLTHSLAHSSGRLICHFIPFAIDETTRVLARLSVKDAGGRPPCECAGYGNRGTKKGPARPALFARNHWSCCQSSDSSDS